MKEFSLKRSDLENVLRRLDHRAAELDMERREKHRLFESLREGIPFPGIESLVPYFYPELGSIFSYLSPDTLIWLDGADRVEAEAERFAQLAWERYEKAKEERRLAPSVETLYLNEHEWREALQPRAQVQGEALTVMASSEKAQEATLTVESFLTSELRHETICPRHRCLFGAACGTAQGLAEREGVFCRADQGRRHAAERAIGQLRSGFALDAGARARPARGPGSLPRDHAGAPEPGISPA